MSCEESASLRTVSRVPWYGSESHHSVSSTHLSVDVARQPASEPNSRSSTEQSVTLDYRKRFKPQWRIFSSKSALLVLAWNALCATTYSVFQPDINSVLFQAVPFVMWPFSAVFFGWLADTHLGHYRVAKLGMVLLFLTSVVVSALIIAKEAAGFDDHLTVILKTVVQTIGLGSTAINPVTLPQVGLEQMPDCSSSNIASFIVWFVFSSFAGFWVGDVVFSGIVSCFDEQYMVFVSLFPVLCLSVALISDFFLTPKWLIIEPKSPQSLKTVFQVLKFSAKHKAPLNRSALTYWEEDIPSRLDLGKSRYGGPFTTEQVENVKTLFRILALTAPMWISLAGFNMFMNNLSIVDYHLHFDGVSNCTTTMLRFFTYDRDIWIAIVVVLYELLVFPLCCHPVFTSLRRIGIVAFFIFLINFVSVLISLYYDLVSAPVHPVLAYTHSLVIAILLFALLTSAMEFVCAQSPHNMRGLLLGYVWFISIFSYMIAQALLLALGDLHSEHPWAVVLHTGLASVLSLTGFVLYCLLARWYKRRVRDDIATPHRWVEEVYDRYLTEQEKYFSEQEEQD